MINLAEIKILVVEDDPAMSEVLCEYLQGEGATTLSAPNGQVALELMEVEKFDLVLTDLQMPIIGGMELLRRIRERDTESPIVLLVTGQADITEEIAIASGAVGLIHKPFDLMFLFEKISQSLAVRVMVG